MSKKTAVSLTPEMYRQFSDLCKVEAGHALEVSSFEAMRNSWGLTGFSASELIQDVRSASAIFTQPVGRIELAETVDVAEFRLVGRSRPELNWAVLSDEEIHPFIVWHEIGHCRDGFSMLDAQFQQIEGPSPGLSMVRMLNEVLADRFAWERIRPGDPLPLTERGRRDKVSIETALQYVSQFYQRAKYKVRPLEAGQYLHVSPRMLESKRMAAFLGPEVHPELLAHYIWKRSGRMDSAGCG